MTQIQANIYKNGDVTKPLAGYILLTARATISDGNNFFIIDPVSYPLVNGSVMMDLVPTVVSKVSYTFAIFETFLEIGSVDRLTYQFDAVVPSSLQPINLNMLAQQSGLRYDQQDASLLTLATFILNAGSLQNRLLDKLLNARGLFDMLLVYKKGDSVLYDGDGYLYVSDIASSGNLPTNVSFWKKYVSKGSTGSGTIGDNSPYGVSWNGSTTTPSRDAVYQRLEQMLTISLAASTYAPRFNAVLTNSIQDSGNPVPLNDSSQRLVNSGWVQQLLNPNRNQTPIGARVKWDNTLALPVRYLRADGSAQLISAFPALAAIYGTAYGAAPVGQFLLPNDTAFIIFTGV